MKFFFPYIAKI